MPRWMLSWLIQLVPGCVTITHPKRGGASGSIHPCCGGLSCWQVRGLSERQGRPGRDRTGGAEIAQGQRDRMAVYEGKPGPEISSISSISMVPAAEPLPARGVELYGGLAGRKLLRPASSFDPAPRRQRRSVPRFLHPPDPHHRVCRGRERCWACSP